ncbi:unnamed protein product [Hymenolepis diminuta]|uniref:ANK_REP_REGION domain-containing protein n=1 Tax=Hymenolepis diminuta TaxID=6216 RepID=A0A0R3SHM6_HYMDI|nr:unnamed protein product [Hymenolepis diminuta]
MVAAARGYTGVLRVLLFHGAAVHAADKNGNFAIHLATIYGHLECVKLLMNWGGLGNVGNLKFLTPLMLAAKYGHFRIFKYLLGKGVNISYQLNRFKESELTLAVRKGCSRIVQLLLKIANPKIDRTVELNRALSIAISLDRLKTTKVLIAFGADVNSIEEDGKPSIYAAILRNNLDLTNCLVSNGADINQKNRFGLTPLMFAIKMEHVNIVRYLIKAGKT